MSILNSDYLILENEQIKLKVLKKGGELKSLYSKKLYKEMLWQGNDQKWSYTAPVLFPFIGNLRNGGFCYNNVWYEAKTHGYSKETDFELKKCSETEIEMSFNCQKNYPFKFCLFTKIFIEGNEIKIKRVVSNLSENEMYFSIGEHLSLNCKIENTSLKFVDGEIYKRTYLDKNLKLLSQRKGQFDLRKEKQLSREMFQDLAIILENVNLRNCYVSEIGKPYKVKISYYNNPFNLVLWSHKDGGDYLCPEIWYGLPDSIDTSLNIEEKTNLIRLEKNKTFVYSFSIEIIEN